MKKKLNKKIAIPAKSGGFKLRVWHRKGKGISCPRFLVKCGDCNKEVEIYYDKDYGFLEINGVHATREEWGKILFPLLKTNQNEKRK